MIVHQQSFDGAGKTYRIVSADPAVHGKTIRVEDYWDRVMGGEFWTTPLQTPAAVKYMLHAEAANTRFSEDIVYGKTKDGMGFAVHVSELDAEVAP